MTLEVVPRARNKGGNPGVTSVFTHSELAFPSYDGNGMYLSMGNMQGNTKIGMLLIDFQSPHRIRIHGDARIVSDDPLLKAYPGAELIVRVAIQEILINCPRYILAWHPWSPRNIATAISAMEENRRSPERAATQGSRHSQCTGGFITPEEYGEIVLKGLG